MKKIFNFNVNWKEDMKFDKRKAVIVVISFLSVALIAVSILAGFLYWNLYRLDSLSKALSNIKKSSESDESEIPATDILDEVGTYFNAYAIEEIDNDKLLDDLVNAFNANVTDKYYSLMTEEEYNEVEARFNSKGKGIGVSINVVPEGLVINKVFKNSPAETAGLLSGDIITAVDGTSIAGFTLADSKALIQGENGTEVKITYTRDGESHEVSVTRSDYTVETVDVSYVEKDGKKVAVITIDAFYYNTDEEFKEAVDNVIKTEVCGIIFDVRNNGGGSLNSVVNMLDYLLPEETIVKIRYKNDEEVKTSDASYATDLPFVVLTNGNTASAAELFTSCLNDYDRATIVGTKTYGKGCGQQTYKLPSGYYLKMTTFMYDPPLSENYNGVGIYPDVEIEYDTATGTDNQLEKAVEILVQK